MNKLKELLNVPGNQFVKNFSDIADTIMNKIAMNINGELFRIMEIEFYVKFTNHFDVFTHGDENQKLPLNWYFHRSSQKDKYAFKGGTYKGLDIACGKDNVYSGILLRSIMNIDTGEIINGTSKIVDKILEKNECKQIKDFVKDTLNDNTGIENNESLSLKSHKYGEKEELFTSPRVGLTLKKKDNVKLRQKYISKLYRYAIFPNDIVKGKKLLLLSAVNTKDNSTLKKYFKLSNAQIEKYKEIIEKLKGKQIDYSKYQGKSLNDVQRMELTFGKVKNIKKLKTNKVAKK